MMLAEMMTLEVDIRMVNMMPAGVVAAGAEKLFDNVRDQEGDMEATEDDMVAEAMEVEDNAACATVGSIGRTSAGSWRTTRWKETSAT